MPRLSALQPVTWQQHLSALSKPARCGNENMTSASQVIDILNASKEAESLRKYNVHGIPYNSTGQAIVERANQTLKAKIEVLAKTEGFTSSIPSGDQARILATALLALNQFPRGDETNSPTQRHWATRALEEGPHVVVKNELGEWEQGWRLVLTGRGYAAVKKDSKDWITGRHRDAYTPVPEESDEPPSSSTAPKDPALSSSQFGHGVSHDSGMVCIKTAFFSQGGTQASLLHEQEVQSSPVLQDDFRKRGDRSFQRGDGFFNSHSAGNLSGLDSGVEGEELPLSEAEMEASIHPQAAERGKVLLPDHGIGSPGVDVVPSKLISTDQ
ncbi:hypothetical protein DUI87_31751 [Hirundo rustica rustica]|uniref:Integrase catalytic domain-containing protein n=1 Tax=Hirundo rustica rustica TaxID=333673 RepID=A0A3M0IYL0_HIRRU|nr:hypothetical protein DUI87_31751 [Hirundo rustica rustica]